MTALEVPTTNVLTPVGVPILPRGTEPQIRKMLAGRFYIIDVPGFGPVVASPYWMAPAATVTPVLEAAGLQPYPGSYECFPTGRSTADRAKVHRLDCDPPSTMMADHIEAAMAATVPMVHRTVSGLPVLVGVWDRKGSGEGDAYVFGVGDDGFGLKATYLDWLTAGADPEDMDDNARRRSSMTYRLRAIDDVGKPVAVWVEEYLDVRYVSAASQRTVARRTMYVLMPVRFPKR